MKKIFSLLAIVLLPTCILFAQSHRITAKPGDTIMVGNGLDLVGKLINQSQGVVQRLPLRKKHRMHHINHTGYLVQQPTVYATPIPNSNNVDSAKLVSQYYQRALVEHDRYMNNLLLFALIGVIIVIILAALFANHVRGYSYVNPGYPNNPTNTHQTFHLNGGAGGTGGHGGESRNTVYADAADCGNYTDIRKTTEITHETLVVIPDETVEPSKPVEENKKDQPAENKS